MGVFDHIQAIVLRLKIIPLTQIFNSPHIGLLKGELLHG